MELRNRSVLVFIIVTAAAACAPGSDADLSGGAESALWKGEPARAGQFPGVVFDGLCTYTRVAYDKFIGAAHCVVRESLATPENLIVLEPGYAAGSERGYAIKRGRFRWTEGLLERFFGDHDGPAQPMHAVDCNIVKAAPAPLLRDDEMVRVRIKDVSVHPSYPAKLAELLEETAAMTDPEKRAERLDYASILSVDLALVTVEWIDSKDASRLGTVKTLSSAPSEFDVPVVATGFRTGRLGLDAQPEDRWVYELGYFETTLADVAEVTAKAAEYQAEFGADYRSLFYRQKDHDVIEPHDSGSPVFLGPVENDSPEQDLTMIGIGHDDTTRIDSGREWLLEHGIQVSTVEP